MFELSSAQTKLKRGGTEKQRPGRSSTAAHEESHRELGFHEAGLLFPRADWSWFQPRRPPRRWGRPWRALGVVARRWAEEESWTRATRPTDSRRLRRSQAMHRPAVGRGWSEGPCRRDGRPSSRVGRWWQLGGVRFRGERVRKERKKKKEKKEERERERERKKKLVRVEKLDFILGIEK